MKIFSHLIAANTLGSFEINLLMRSHHTQLGFYAGKIKEWKPTQKIYLFGLFELQVARKMHSNLRCEPNLLSNSILSPRFEL